MHHGQSRGETNARKVYKKQVKLSKTRGKFVKVGGKISIFAKHGGNVKWGNVLKQGNSGKIRNLWSMTKKGSSEISAAENQEMFLEKVKL